MLLMVPREDWLVKSLPGLCAESLSRYNLVLCAILAIGLTGVGSSAWWLASRVAGHWRESAVR
jgi:hypothetical protein